MRVRNIEKKEIDWLLEFNNCHTPEVGELTKKSLEELIELAEPIRVVEIEGEIVAALVIFLPNSTYQSTNYCWFNERYENFLYVDRIMVSQSARGLGVGRYLYEELYRQGVDQNRQAIFCEVNEAPPNPKSMAFHQRMGFTLLESRLEPKSGKTVQMLMWKI